MSPPDPPSDPKGVSGDRLPFPGTFRGPQIDTGDWSELVEMTEGTRLVVGGPGTGKTELLADRAAFLINKEIANSDQVLALSFSRETAADLRDRITSKAERSFGELSVCTFHGLARTLVEENSQEIFGAPQPPMLLTAPEQIQFVKEVLSEEDPGEWPLLYRRMLRTHTLAEELADFMLRCGEQRITVEDLASQAAERPAWKALPGFYQRYLHGLERHRKIDYTGLLLRANRALGRPELNGRTAARFPYILVDEYQEATLVQVEIVKKLVGGGCHLTAVADPRQTSFSFRGAERASVSDFSHTFGDVGTSKPEVFTLTNSFRVPEEVLSAAGALIGDDVALPAPAPHRGRVEFYVFHQDMAQYDWIASEMKRLHLLDRVPYSEMAALTRASHVLPALSRSLDRVGVPHTRPGARLIDHPAVRLVLDLAWVAERDHRRDPSPRTVAAVDRIMESVLLGPLFRLPQGRARELAIARRQQDRPWSEVLAERLPDARALSQLLEDPSWALNPPATTGFWELWRRIPQFQGVVESVRAPDHAHALFSFAQTLGRLAERSPLTSLLDYRSLTVEGRLEASPLLSPAHVGEEHVTLSTIHQAKGRQFQVVFIAGATEGVFPDTRPFRSLLESQILSRRHLDYFGLMEARLAEEQNLAYIAMTRAHQRVIWSATSPDLEEQRRTVSRFMVRLADRAGTGLAMPSARPAGSPVGSLETESYLRRTQKDLRQTSPRRLAAAMALAHPIRADLWDPRSFAGVRPPGSDLGLIDPGHVMSASQAEAYKTCPRRYALERRLRIRSSEDSTYARFGQLIHSVLHSVGERQKANRESRFDLAEAVEEFHRQLPHFDFGTPVVNRAFSERGEKLLTQLAERWRGERGEAIAFEKAVEANLGGVPWKGRIDRIDRLGDGRLRIVDYKASNNPITLKEAKVALQLGFYLWALSQTDPRASMAEFWFPLSEGNSWKRAFDPANLAEVTRSLEQIAQEIVSEASDPDPWPAKPSQACGQCQVRSLCPAWPEGQGAFST